MYQKKTPVQLDCGLHFFKELLNGKWKLMLVYYISKNLKRPSELQRKIPNADRRVMDQQLQELVLHGFINKKTFNTKVPKVEYELTELGEKLLPLILTIEQWGEENRFVLNKALEKDPKFENVV
ncbi:MULTISPECIES: winged helix-turn-helix transcriptional regulator [Bacteroidota]|uniref:winged helix-turn-helix transcriptional regulator n=1 Tax=Bacteroidota TaxID=976 RepID=UPI00047A2197|nr:MULTISPECIES: helix-turn-helix domain-containing protein [Bacteroidota]MCW2259763.1 DNA-binding HxlR family transcriptional regulator [Sphingobacterium kitahiroshimense]TCR03397.1 HxlR family transcriptional regulator [Sphingobacterium sp. JUb78]